MGHNQPLYRLPLLARHRPLDADPLPPRRHGPDSGLRGSAGSVQTIRSAASEVDRADAE